MRDYQQHFRTRKREIPKRQISTPFHRPKFNLSEIPYPLIVIPRAWKHLGRASPYMSLQGVLPTQELLISSDEAGFKRTSLVRQLLQFVSTIQTCCSQSTSSMEPFLLWSGPSSKTLLASNHVYNTNTNKVTQILVVQFHRTMVTHHCQTWLH